MTSSSFDQTRQTHRPLGRVLRRSAAAAALGAALVGTLAVPAGADTSGDTTEANVSVLSGITLTGLTPSFTLTGTPGATVTEVAAVTFNVETNNESGYSVTVQAQSDSLVPPTPGNTDEIPIGALTVREGSDAFQALSDAGTTLVHTQTDRSVDGGDEFSNDYRIRIPTVAADTYSATLDYVATTSL